MQKFGYGTVELFQQKNGTWYVLGRETNGLLATDQPRFEVCGRARGKKVLE